MQNPALPIGQIAEALHFAGQSTFGQVSHTDTVMTSATYRQRP